jgi:pentatricopeptide repeat protein
VMYDETVNNNRKSENDLDQFVQPNSRTFNMVLSAWAKIGEAERAEKILMEMHKLHVEDDFDTRPTVVSYNAVLDSYAQKTNRIMNDNKNTGLKNSNKRTNKHTRTNNQGEDAPWNRAEAILNHMIDLCRGGDLSLKPTARTWNTGKSSIESFHSNIL